MKSNNSKTSISEATVRHIADLAKIKLSSTDVKKFRKELADIISYFNKLQEVDTTGVEPTSQVTNLVNKFRSDEIRDFLSDEHALQNAADKKGNYFRTISPFKGSDKLK